MHYVIVRHADRDRPTLVGAVAKVFLLDASGGLEGLMRIASFVALGLGLSGIGRLYSRSLGGLRPLSGLP
jgi:hypothetical protein